jgi:hypothetical protein
VNDRLHATAVLARLRVRETLIGAGWYVAMTVGLLLGYLLVAGFARSIDSSGFDYQLNPVYQLIGRALAGALGATFVEKLFAEGPCLFVLYVAFLPVMLYLTVSSVFRFGLEKKVGAIELLCYGPADGTSYFVAGLTKDVLLTVLYLAVLVVFVQITALLHNLAVGPSFFLNLPVLLCASIAVHAYGVLASTIADNSASAIALFLGLLLLFAVILMGTFTIVSGYVRSLAGVLAWCFQWVSPMFYWNLVLGHAEVGAWGRYLLGNLLLLLLAAAVLWCSHVIIKARGVRP